MTSQVHNNLSHLVIPANLSRMNSDDIQKYNEWKAKLVLNREIPDEVIQRMIEQQTEREIGLQDKLNDAARIHVERDHNQQALEDKIAELQSQLAVMEHKAHTDKLTGLPNRAGFQKRYEEMIQIILESEEDLSFCIGFLDLTGFKKVNDELGHKKGDVMLRAVGQGLDDEFSEASNGEMEVSTHKYAQLLKESSFRKTDFIAMGRGPARYGGDEFVILAPCSETFGEAEFKNKIDNVFPIVHQENDGLTYNVGTNVGVVRVNKEQLAKYTPSRLMAQADALMYLDKHGVKPDFFDELFEPDVEGYSGSARAVSGNSLTIAR